MSPSVGRFSGRRALVRAVLASALVCGAVVASVTQAAGSVAPEELVPPRTIAPGEEQPPPGWPTPPPLTAAAHIALDVGTGQVLAADNADEPRLVASTIKILTALSVLRRTSPDDVVTVGREVVGLPWYAAGVGLEPGARWTVEELLTGLIARSGNDAALALAVHVGGSVDDFVDLMRQDADALGLDGSGIRTPHGLGDRDRMSARDLATVARVLLRDPILAEISAQATVRLPGIGRIASRNELLGAYPGADGLKTGYTIAAGRCLIASATRDGRQALVVVLGSADPTGHFDDSRALLDHAFDRFESVRFTRSDADLELRRAGRWVELAAPPVELLVPDGRPRLDLEVHLPVEVQADEEVAAIAGWEGHELARTVLERVPDERDPATPDVDRREDAVRDAPQVGGWMVERTYAAMRAATRGGAWPTAGRLPDDRAEGGLEPTDPTDRR